VDQGEGQRFGHRRSGQYAGGTGAGQQRGDGQAQLAEQAGVDQLGQQARAAFGQDVLVAPVVQRRDHRLRVDGHLPGDDHVGVPAHRGPHILGGPRGGDDDRAGHRGSIDDQRTRRVQVQAGGDDRYWRCR